MAKYSTTVEYNIQTRLDASGLTQLQRQLQQCDLELSKLNSYDIISDRQLSTARGRLNSIQSALRTSFNAITKTMDMTRFSNELTYMGESFQSAGKFLNSLGITGKNAFTGILSSVGKLDTGLKATSKITDKIWNTLGNTVRWGVIASAFQEVMNAAHNAVQYMQDLDRSLTDIMLVSDYTKEDMREFAQYANEAAAALGNTTVAYTDAAMIYAQQGYNLEDQKALADMTLKVANVTGQETSEVSEQMTSIINGYGLAVDDLGASMDQIAKIANISAADVEELAVASSRVAATASALGVDQSQLYSQIGTIVSVTREAPEVVGNALKTIYARFGDLKMGDTLEDGVDLGSFSGALEKLGVQVLDTNGQMRDMGSIIEDLMQKWNTFDRATQQSAAVTLAGKFQYNRLMTLMNNQDMYYQYLEEAESNSLGTLDEMESEYLDSLAGKSATLQATVEGLLSSLFDQSQFTPIIGFFTDLIGLVAQLVQGVGGGIPVLTAFASLMTRNFAQNIGRTISKHSTARQAGKMAEDSAASTLEMLNQVPVGTFSSNGQNSIIDFAKYGQGNAQYFNKEQTEQYNNLLGQTVEAVYKATEAESKHQAAINATNACLVQLNRTQEDQLVTSATAERALLNGQSALENMSQDQMNAVIESHRESQEGIAMMLGSLDEKNGSILNFEDFDFGMEYLEANIDSLAPEIQQKINDLIIKTRESLEQGEIDIREYGNQWRTIGSNIQAARETLIAGNQYTSPEQYRQGELDRQGANINLNNVNAVNGAFTNEVDAQKEYAQISSIIAAVGQLSFAWMSFQNLGTLFAQDDLEVGEKLTQIIMNLAFTIPMIKDAITALNASKLTSTVTSGLQGLERNLLQYAMGAARARIEGEQLTRGQQLLASGAGLASGAIGKFGKVVGALGGPIGIAMIAITAITSVLSYFDEQAKQAYENAKTTAENAASLYDEKNTKKDNFNKAYDQYKQTGKVTDELKQSAQELSDTINDQSAAVALAAGNYKQFADAIGEADKESRKMAEQDIQAFLNGSNADSLKGSWNNGSIYSDLKAALPKQTVSSYKGVPNSGYLNTDTANAITEAGKNNDPAKAIGAIKKQIADYRKQLNDLDNELSNTANEKDRKDIGKKKEKISKYIGKLNDALNADDIKDYLDNNAKLAEYGAQDLQENLKGKNAQEIIDTYLNDENTRDYVESLGNWSDQLSWMIQNTSDETAKLKLQLKQATDNASNNLYDLGKKLAEGNSLQTFDENGNLTTESSEDIGNALSKYVLNKVDNAAITNKAKLNFLATIDTKQSLDQILNDLEELKNNPELQAELEFSVTYTNRVDNTQDELDNLLSDTGMSENAFNRMASDIYHEEDGFFQNRLASLQDDLKNINGDNFKDYVQEAKNAEDATDVLKSQIADLGAEAKDTAAYNIRLGKGVADLTDLWENYGEVLKDDASKGTADWYEAVGKLDEAISDILNIDVGTLSNDFYELPEAMSAMEDVANGDMNAIDRLRDLASQNIITNMEIIPVGDDDVDEIRQNLMGIRDQLQAQISQTPLEMRTDLDLSEYEAKLNEMIAAGQITAEQATAVLSSMGVSATITNVPADVTVPTWTYHMTGSLKNLLSGDADAESEVTVSSIQTGTTEMHGYVPQITGSHYTGPGITSVGGKSSGRTGGSGGGGGSKGGGGSGKTSKPKTKDPIKEEVDRYERVNTLLDDTEHKFEKVAEEQDRLAGFDQADNMNKQIKLLEKQIALHKEKLAIQQQEAKELRDELSSQFGVTFDAEGFITNYAATHRKLENEVNSLINQYNATGTEEGQEALDKQIEAAQKRLDKFKDKYQRYDELFAGDMNDTLKTLEDLEDQIEDLRIKALQTQVEAVENLKDLQETLIDFNSVFSGLNKDDPLRDMSSSAQKLAKYFDDGTASANDFYNTLISRTQQLMNQQGTTPAMKKWYQAQIDQMRAAQQAAGSQSMQTYGTGYLDMELLNLQMMMEQLNEFEKSGASSVFGEDSGDLYEVAKDVFDSATDMIEEYEDEIENLKDAILDAIDEVGDRIDERREQFENITDELDHQREIAELLRGDENYDEINQLLQAQQNNYQASLGSLQDQLDVLKDLQAGLKEDSEEWKAVQEMIVDTQEELNDLVEESLDNLREQYENTVADIGNKWVDSALGTDLDWMEEQWELINRNADYYLDDTNAAYETQKLQSKYLDLLDNAGDLHTQQLITEQMAQQLGYLREKEKISEYDVKYAEMQIELLQKRIALEEAQRSKQQLKLRRDSQGNYNYVYTADNEATKAAQDEYLDAQNNAYNLSKEQMKQTQEDSLSALQDARKLIDDIWNNANLSLDEKKQRTQTIIDSLKEYLDGTSEQLSTSEQNIIQDFIGMVELMTDENAERLQSVYDQIVQGNIDAFDQIDTRWSDSLTDWLQNLDDFNANTDQMFQNLIDNAENYQDQTDQVAELVEQNFNRVTDAVNKAQEATQSLADSNADFINQLKNDAGVIQDYEGVMQEYADKIRDAENAMRAYQTQVNELQNKMQAKERENANLASQVQDLKQQLTFGVSGAGGGGAANVGGGHGVGTHIGYNGKYYYDSWGTTPAGNLFAGQAGAVTVDSYSSTEYGGKGRNVGAFAIHISAPERGYDDLGWIKPSQMFDTGGYTGDWSDGNQEAKNGKIAWLHSKEMVLNEEDTRNILSAVEAVRDMTASIKHGALSGLTSSLLNSKGAVQPQVENVDQTVSITAEFPNATNADDIREAILGLSEQAFQYAHRTR